MGNIRGELPEDLGFQNGFCGPHSSRTIMVRKVSILFDSTPPAARKEDYARVIIDENILCEQMWDVVELLHFANGLNCGRDVSCHGRPD